MSSKKVFKKLAKVHLEGVVLLESCEPRNRMPKVEMSNIESVMHKASALAPNPGTSQTFWIPGARQRQ